MFTSISMCLIMENFKVQFQKVINMTLMKIQSDYVSKTYLMHWQGNQKDDKAGSKIIHR